MKSWEIDGSSHLSQVPNARCGHVCSRWGPGELKFHPRNERNDGCKTDKRRCFFLAKLIWPLSPKSQYRHVNGVNVAAWKKGTSSSQILNESIQTCRVSWLGMVCFWILFQDLSTWTLDELKALKVSTEGKSRSRWLWEFDAFDVTPLQPPFN